MVSTVAFVAGAGVSTERLEVVPVVDGIPLTDRVHAFEQETGIETRPPSYAGLVPSNFRCAPATEHYLGRAEDRAEGAKTQLLGCSCGEWGCWPLLARIVVEPDMVRWVEFEQPHRPDRDYSGFGPFAFDRVAYELAVQDLADVWDAAE
jgi:hypothetical protein